LSPALNEFTLQHFLASDKIAPQICGGGGDVYLQRLRNRFGQSTLSFFLSAYRETLCGDPQDLTCVEGCYITRTAMRHLYHLTVLHRFVRNYYMTSVDFVEIGGGFGNLARLVTQFSLSRRYFIIDFPASICIQYYYLTEFFDESSVALWNGIEYVTGNAESKICLVIPEATPALASFMSKPSVLVSTLAMTEIPPEGQCYYLDHLDVDVIYIFGQTRTNALPQGRYLSNYEEMSNQELFERLAAMCHTIEFSRGDYYSEFLGLIIDR
jgi:putative sugar O-methyltransferase